MTVDIIQRNLTCSFSSSCLDPEALLEVVLLSLPVVVM